MKQKRLTFLLLLISNLFCASAQKWYKPEIDLKVEELLSQMTVEEKLGYIGGIDWMYTKSIDRLGIHRMRMSDGPQGIGTKGKSTAYPATVTLAATWNENLAYQYGKALGRDCRARNINVILGPAVNIYRAPMCGRNFEYMGEDPYLTSRICVGYIKGVQDQGVMATVKHFVANNSDYDRNNISNDIDERTLNEIYFPAYKAAIQEAEVGAIMTSYNLMNGIYTTENPWLLKEVLRNQWGFKGLVMSDWGSTHYCVPAARSGLDLEMAGGEKMNPKDMAYYLKTGDVTMDMVDEKVRHILRILIAFGFKDGTEADKSIALDDPQSVETALNVAREGLVLLKNENNILPINPQKYKHIIVTGKNAHGYVHGGGSGAVVPFHYTNLFDGIQKEGKLNNVKVEYIDELDFMPSIMYTDDNLNEKGFHAEYFKNIHFEGAPVVKQTEKKINYSWAAGTELEGMPKDYFSVKWYSTMCVDETADYEFTLGGDDGYKLFINDQPIIDDWTPGGFRTTNVTKTLKAGEKYHIRVEYYHQGGGYGLAQGGSRQHQRAATAVRPALRAGKRPHHGGNTHRLLCQLAEHVRLHPPPRQKKAAQHRRDRHPRQPQRRGAQRGSSADIPQPPLCRKTCGGKLGDHGKPAQRKPCQHQPHQHPARSGLIPAELLGQQPGSRHRDARRSQRNEQSVHRQHQLVQPHTRPAQGVSQPDAQPHACQPQHHVRTGKQRRIFKVVLPHPAPPPAPERAFTVQPMQRLCKT